jgi:hypothetical protein
MGIFSGGGGGGFAGGTVPARVFVNNAAATVALEAKGGVGGANLFQLDSQAHDGVLQVFSEGGIFLRPESGGIPVFVQPRDTGVPAITVRGMTTAPPDGSLQPNDVTYWLDSTAGASKFMVKAKSADGTVVTGSVSLT